MTITRGLAFSEATRIKKQYKQKTINQLDAHVSDNHQYQLDNNLPGH